MFDFSNFKNADNAGIRQAIMAVCDKMLNPQARLKGICGIEKFGKDYKMGFLRCGKAADGGNNQLFSDKCGWGDRRRDFQKNVRRIFA